MDEASEQRDHASRLGLIAGAGELPSEVARLFAAEGIDFEVFGFSGISESDLVPEAHYLRLGQLVALASRLEAVQVDRLLIVGKFSKRLLLDPESLIEPDAEAIRLLSAAGGWDDAGLMSLIAGWLEERGLEIVAQDELLTPLLAKSGPLSDRAPSERERADGRAGQHVVEQLGHAGVGQAAAIRQGCVVALEAAEGTDAMILRAGEVGGAGATIVKAARPGQDRRFDLPAVGPGTIEAMRVAGATGLAIEAGSTLIVDPPRFREQADGAGIAVWAFEPGAPGGSRDREERA